MMEMQRSYEDPRKLEKRIEEIEKRIEETDLEDFDSLASLFEEKCELQDRLNYAWQDEEHLMNSRRDEFFYE